MKSLIMERLGTSLLTRTTRLSSTHNTFSNSEKWINVISFNNVNPKETRMQPGRFTIERNILADLLYKKTSGNEES